MAKELILLSKTKYNDLLNDRDTTNKSGQSSENAVTKTETIIIQNQYHQQNSDNEEVDLPDKTPNYLHSQKGNGFVVKKTSNDDLPPGTLERPYRKKKKKSNIKWLKY